MSHVQFIANPSDIDRLAANAVAHGCGHTAELLRAARRSEIAALLLKPATPAPMKWLRRVVQPCVVVIGDDPGDEGLKPSAWLAARRLIEWHAFAVVHGAGGTVADYRFVVELAKLHRRLPLIECTSTRADEWAEVLMRRKPRAGPFIGFLPRSGPHPVALPASCRQ